ncbi:hypothetical protein FSP39_002308 [Pinctada imbricata]|uniref:Carbohydrate sulfotransferase n=1 Tax=Pinctada imbricata TaxID=66713 RepID=A0AA88XVC0_PINIB|nr:hypothetical protein FSP39_002308 [Pinctada imbricata]
MRHYKTVCRNRDSADEDDPMATLGDNFQISRRHRLVYCSVLKAGSTFWRRFLQVIDSGKVRSPYSIEAKDVNEKSETLQNVFIEDLYEMSQKNLLFMFSRNPYKRLLSAYLDKLYSANPLFWHSWGHKIKRKPHTICYHDITFEEFLRYVVKLEKAPLWKRDPHYASMREVCKPCQIQYDFIGKIESFKEDVFFFLDHLNLSRYKGVFKDFEEDTFSDSIWDISHTFEDWKRNIRKCMSMHEAFQRTWRRLQIRGQISENMTFPLNEWQSKNLPRHEFFEIVEDAHKRSKNKTDLVKQRENMFQRIYSTVPKDLLNELFHVLRPDFDIFDYEKFSQFQNVSPDEDLFDFKNTKY